jgi:hypothetical protein
LDVIATAKECGEIELERLANLRRPYAQFKRTLEVRTLEQVEEIVSRPTADSPPLSQEQISERMDKGENTLGKVICFGASRESPLIRVSYWTMAQRGEMRVLLASAIYRRTHQNSLPQTKEGFLPILGKWPDDPFSGNPLIYLPKEQKVYSIGADLKDDGGDVNYDIVVSLKPTMK